MLSLPALVLRLREADTIEAHHEYPGVVVFRWVGCPDWIATGQANPVWTAQEVTEDDRPLGPVELDDADIPRDSDDMERIARTLMNAAFERHRIDDPHCTCNDCVHWFFEPRTEEE